MNLLVDRFNRRVTYLRLSVTDRCNFQCRYCAPSLPKSCTPKRELLSFEEMERIVRAFAHLGLERVRLTGGEPTIRADLPELVSRLNNIPGIAEVTMTTNGYLLERLAQPLFDAGMRRLNVSLDTLDPSRFSHLTGVVGMARVGSGIAEAQRVGFSKLKLNSVIIRGVNDKEVADLVRWAAQRDLTPRFIELMPIGDGAASYGETGFVSASEMRSRLEESFTLTPEENTVEGGGPARYWRAQGPGIDPEGHLVGFIAAVSECFCEGCNRVRLTPEGGLRACLADDREESLRDRVRAGASDEALIEAIRETLWGKKRSHAFDQGAEGGTRRAMTTIGG